MMTLAAYLSVDTITTRHKRLPTGATSTRKIAYLVVNEVLPFAISR